MDAADILSYFFGAVQAAVQILLLCKLFSRKSNLLSVILFILMNIAANTLPMPFFAALIISAASIVLCCRFAFRTEQGETWQGALLYGILSSEIMWLCYGIFDSLFSLFADGTNFSRYPFVGILFLIFGNIFSLTAYCFGFSAAYKIIKNEQAEFRNLMIISIPLILVFIVEIYIIRVLYNSVETRSGIDGDIELLLVQGLGFASVFCVLFAYKKFSDSLKMREKIMLYDRERHYSEQYANEVKTYYDGAKSLRHDFKNHILIIGELLKKEQYQKAENYISELNKIAENTELKFHTGCPILDIIFTDKFSGISNKVTVECDAVPKIDETDICVIFANAADNAVTAVSKLSDEARFIKVAVKSRGNLLFIEFENSFDGKPFEIGTGIKNIISAAEKYSGTAKISTQGKTFSLKILCNSQH